MSGSVEHELRTHSEALRKLARLLVGAQEADDLVQDIALQALHRPPEQPVGLRRWLLAVLRHRASKHRRSEQRRQRRERGAPLPDPEATPLRIAEHKETLARLHGALLALPEPYLGTLLLRFFEDLTPSQIAEHTAVPLATVKSRLQRGLGLLRERLDAEPGDWRSALTTAFGLGEALKVAGAAAIGTGVVMTSGVKLACAGVVAVLGIAAWLWFGNSTGQSGRAGTDRSSDTVAASSTTDATRHPTVAATDAGVARSEIEPKKAEPRPGYVRLRVVRAEDDAPLPGAEVSFFDQDATPVFWRDMQAQLDCDGDPFAKLLRQGRRAIADAAGEVDLPMRIMGSTAVAATASGRAGYADLPSIAPEHGYRLRLAISQALHVHVEHPNGSPAVAAPVAVIYRDGDGEESMRSLGLTDAQGTLSVRLPAVLKQGWSKGCWLGVAAPGLEALRVPFDPEVPLERAVRLSLPPTGTVKLSAQDGKGGSVAGEFEIAIHRLAGDGKQGPLCRSIAVDASGQATLTFVGLGERMRARAFGSAWTCTLDFDGPVRADETVIARLLPAEGAAVVRGLLLTESGTAEAMHLGLEVEGVLAGDKRLHWSGFATTDASGQFCLCLGGAAKAVELQGRLKVDGTRRHVDDRFAEFHIVVQPGVRHHDAGTLQLKTPGIVMTGRVVLADGTPVDRARLDPGVEIHEVLGDPSGPGPDLMLREPVLAPMQVDEEGGFILFASEQAPPRSLRVTAADCLPETVPVVPGARDVRVVLKRACKLTVEVRVSPGLGCDPGVRVELAGRDPIIWDDRTGDAKQGQWSELGPGNYRLALWLLGGTEPLDERTVTLPSQDAERERRERFDLGNALRAARVSLINETGEPVTLEGILMTPASSEVDGRRLVDAFTVHGGVAHVVATGRAMTFEAIVQGYAPQQFSGPVEDVTLRLQPLAKVPVHVAGLEQVPEHCQVNLTAQDIDRVNFTVRYEHGVGFGPGLLAWFSTTLVNGAGQLALRRACRLRCNLSLRSSHGAEDVPLPEVAWNPGQDQLSISVDPAELRAALGRLR